MVNEFLKVPRSHLTLLIERRQDDLGKVCYVVTSSSGRVRFRNLDSVIDFISMNNDLGFIK